MRQRGRRILGKNGTLVGEKDFSNFCITNPSQSSPWYGHVSGSGSTINPDTLGGLLAYEYKWNDAGVLEIRFGAAGNEKVFETNLITISDHTYQKIGLFIWDEVELLYSHTDPEWTGWLIADAMNPVCFHYLGHPNPYNIVNGANNIVNGTNEITNPREI